MAEAYYMLTKEVVNTHLKYVIFIYSLHQQMFFERALKLNYTPTASVCSL
jgi:hypothetical protein